MHGQEAMDIGPADQQRKKGDPRPDPMGGEEDANDENAGHRKQQKGKGKSQQGNEPPFSGMQIRIGAGQQEKNNGNYV